MNKINQFIDDNMKMIILVFLFLNPFLDVFTGLQEHYLTVKFSFSSIIRLIFMSLSIYYIFRLDNTVNKDINKKYIIIFLIYLVLFSITTLISKDYHALSYELKNTLNTFYFPIVLIASFDIFSQYKINIKLSHIIILYMIYVAFVFFPTILGVGFDSYYHSKEGSVGFFISANAVGNILSILMPFLAYYLINYKEYKVLNIFMVIMILIVLAGMGTKVPVLSLMIVLLVHFIYYIKKWIKEKKYKNIKIVSFLSIILLALILIIIPKTSFYKNIQIHKKFLGINHYYEVITDYHLIDHFIFSQRLTFLSNTNENYKKSNILEKINGIGYIENYGTDSVSTKTIEIDYFEVFYRQGILGFIIFLYPVIRIVKYAYLEIKEKTLINLEYKTSYILMLLLGLFSGHIFVTPAVSIFVSLIIVTSFTHEKNRESKYL